MTQTMITRSTTTRNPKERSKSRKGRRIGRFRRNRYMVARWEFYHLDKVRTGGRVVKRTMFRQYLRSFYNQLKINYAMVRRRFVRLKFASIRAKTRQEERKLENERRMLLRYSARLLKALRMLEKMNRRQAEEGNAPARNTRQEFAKAA